MDAFSRRYYYYFSIDRNNTSMLTFFFCRFANSDVFCVFQGSTQRKQKKLYFFKTFLLVILILLPCVSSLFLLSFVLCCSTQNRQDAQCSKTKQTQKRLQKPSAEERPLNSGLPLFSPATLSANCCWHFALVVVSIKNDLMHRSLLFPREKGDVFQKCHPLLAAPHSTKRSHYRTVCFGGTRRFPECAECF